MNARILILNKILIATSAELLASPISSARGWRHLSYQCSSHCCRGRTPPFFPRSWINAHMSTCICHLPITSNQGEPETILKRRTLILFTAFSSVYSYHTKWLTVSLLSYPQRHVDILHNYHSQSWGSQATLWLAQNRNLLWYSSQSGKTSPSIHKTPHQKVSRND